MYKIMLGNDEIFNPTRMSDLPVQEARQSEQLNEPGALQFTLIHGHPKYGLLEGMASYITAYDDDDIIFYGRVITDGLPTFSGQITYDCEGALSFLNDSEVTPSKNPISKTPQQLFEWCIQQHNADIGNDSRRTFTAGNVTVSEKNKSEQFQITSYTKTKDVIDNQLINVYGGYLKVRYDNGVRYLDWLEHYSDSVNPQTILIGENVIDRAFSNSGEGLFTVIRPVGKNGLLLDTQTIDVFSQEMIDKYGRIVKSVSFSDASTKAALQTKAEEYVARIKKTLLCTGSIKMVDMHYIDGTSPKVQLGDRFTNIEGLNGVEMTISALERDFMHEYEDSCEFGNDKSLREDGVRAGGSISKSSSRAGSSAGMNYKHIVELGNTVTINSEILNEYGVTLEQHYEMINQSADQIVSLSNDYDNMDSRLQTVEGTGVIQNDELLANFAGTMRLVKNNQGIVTGIQFVDGTMVMDTVDGHMVTVGAAVAAAKNGVESIQGSALWNNRNAITGVAGEFEVVEDPLTHVKTLVIKSGGGMKIRRDNVEYGLYDSGNLTGGLIVNKLADGTVQSTISGDLINLGTGLTDSDLNTWAKNARDGAGVFAKYLTVKRLTAQEIETMLADIDHASIGHLYVTGVSGDNDQFDIDVDGHAEFSTVEAGALYDSSSGSPVPLLVSNVAPDPHDSSLLVITYTDGTTANFRKAASSISGSWSGGKYTVTAGGLSKSIGFNGNPDVPLTIEHDNASQVGSSKYVTVPISIYSWDTSNNQEIKETPARYTTNLTVLASDFYNAAWNAARNAVEKPTSDIGRYVDGNYKSIIVKIPKTNGSSEKDSYTYTLSKNDSFTPSGASSAIRVVELKINNNVVARIDVNSYYTSGVAAGEASGYNNGWVAARNSVVNKTYTVSNKTYNYTPTSAVADANQLQYIKVAVPNETVDGNLVKRTYYVTSDNNTAYIRYNSASGSIVAKIDHNKYNSGYNTGWNDGGKASYVAYQTNPTVPSGVTPTELSYNTNYKFYARYNDNGGTARDASGNAYAARYFKTKADRYNDGYDANDTAWLYENNTGNAGGNLNPGIWVTAGYRDHNNAVHYCGTRWYTLSVWGVKKYTGSTPSSYQTLDPNSIYEICYDNGNGGTPGSGKYVKTPSSGSSPSYSVSGIEGGNNCLDPSTFLSGYTKHNVTVGSKQQGYYQYIKFSVDGHKHAFYF